MAATDDAEASASLALSLRSRRRLAASRVHALVVAIRDGDETKVADAVTQLSQTRRGLAPLAFMVGAFAMLFEGLRLLVTNWRLSLIQMLPAMWIWAAMMDLKIHLLRGHSFIVIRGDALVAAFFGVVLITVICYFLNAVFAFAIARPGQPAIRPAFAEARHRWRVITAWGLVMGVALAMATTWMPRHGKGWFSLVLGIVVGLMMYTYVEVPSRLLGAKSTASRRDQLSATVIGGVVGVIVCAPAYVVGRLGIVMISSKTLLVVGIVVLSIGIALQAGMTGAVKAIKMSAKLVAGHPDKVAAEETEP
jgi:hypothetical protein